jgi:hypothetical protein
MYLRGWFGFFRIVTKAEERTLRLLDAHLRRRLRAIILGHWKRKRTIAKRLIRLGVRERTAWRGVYRGKQGRWALSHCSVVDRGLPNAYFADRGLVSLLARWQAIQPREPIAPRQLWLPFGIAAGGYAGAGLRAHA